MKRSIVMCTIMSLLITSGSVFGFFTGTSYDWDASVPNYNPSATIHPGMIDTSLLVFADFVGSQLLAGGTSPVASGYGTHVDWDDGSSITGLGHGNTNGDTLDGFWVGFLDPCWWDLGAPASTVVVFGSQTLVGTPWNWYDYLDEGLEYRIFGANTLWDDSSLGPQATVTDIYLDGWRPHNPTEDKNGNGWCTDDVTAVFDLHGSYRYVKVPAWSIPCPGGYPEIDAIATVIPAPGALVLISIGVCLVGWLRRSRTL